MPIYSKTKQYTIYHGKMQDELNDIADCTIDSIVTDPPYELNFMNKGWDNSGVAFQKETWQNCLRVLKPGGYLLAFGGSRTYHRIACAIEDAGFEIRDTIMWLYGSGFPKSMNIANALEGREKVGSANKKDFKKLDGVKGKINLGWNKTNAELGYRDTNYNGQETTVKVNITTEIAKKWQGWGTCLKPAYEPIIVARKPFAGSLVDNILKNGVGGLNIDECRVPHSEECKEMKKQGEIHSMIKQSGRYTDTLELKPEGRFPANIITDGSEEVAAGFPEGSHTGHRTQTSIDNCIESRKRKKGNSQCDIGGNITKITEYTDYGSAMRYFYCAKASKKDRDEGCEAMTDRMVAASNQAQAELKRGNIDFDNNGFNKVKIGKNIHPTVKPTALMQYLVRLVSPKGATILDPFMGSGSTGKAVMIENAERNAEYKFVGVEMTDEYLPIAEARIRYGAGLKDEPKAETQKREPTETGFDQIDIFEFLKRAE